MDIKHNKTMRGFDLISFSDRYGEECTIQKSSLATDEAIWFGPTQPSVKIMRRGKGWVDFPIPEGASVNTRMHLTQQQVKNLLPILQKFAETGDLPTPPQSKVSEEDLEERANQIKHDEMA